MDCCAAVTSLIILCCANIARVHCQGLLGDEKPSPQIQIGSASSVAPATNGYMWYLLGWIQCLDASLRTIPGMESGQIAVTTRDQCAAQCSKPGRATPYYQIYWNPNPGSTAYCSCKPTCAQKLVSTPSAELQALPRYELYQNIEFTPEINSQWEFVGFYLCAGGDLISFARYSRASCAEYCGGPAQNYPGRVDYFTYTQGAPGGASYCGCKQKPCTTTSFVPTIDTELWRKV